MPRLTEVQKVGRALNVFADSIGDTWVKLSNGQLSAAERIGLKKHLQSCLVEMSKLASRLK